MTFTASYSEFLAQKERRVHRGGVKGSANDLHPHLFPFQRAIVSWALDLGRAAIFADTGLGKTLMQLEWARRIGERVLILAPLAVSAQTAREAQSIDLDVTVCRTDGDVRAGINVTNYERVEKFDVRRFDAVVLDESSILKAFDGRMRAMLTEQCADTRYRLACTATPSPNDTMELGNHAEFLGVMKMQEMLATYFAHDGGETQKWRIKGHAKREFWRWVASWAAMVQKPSDLGYDDAGYHLPELRTHEHIVTAEADGQDSLFALPAQGLMERRAARRNSIEQRVQRAFEIAIIEGACGSQNTPRTGEKSISQTHLSESGENRNHGHRKKIRNTCENGASVTPASSLHISQNSVKPECEASTESDTTTMPHCLRGSESGVLFAPNRTPRNDHYTLTTATKQAASEDCSALDAITDSDTSATTRSGLLRQPATSLPILIWCELNAEQDALTKAFGDAAFSVYGSMTADEKISQIHGWLRGERQVMISKPSIMGFGLNFQHCHKMLFVGISDSWESLYQAIRRCYRFGQQHPVDVHLILSEPEISVLENLKRKERDAQHMRTAMVAAAMEGFAAQRPRPTYKHPEVKVPNWLQTAS